MLKSPKVYQPSVEFHLPTPPTHPTQIQNIPSSPSSAIIRQCCKLSRRKLAIFGNSSLLLLLGSQTLEPFNISKAKAEESMPDAKENDPQDGNNARTRPACTNKTTTTRAFLDISIDGEPVGRIVVGLYGEDVPAGAARFSNLRTGSNLAAESLVDEWEREHETCPGIKNLPGTVSIIVRDPSKPPPKLKLVARQGKLVIDQEEIGTDPEWYRVCYSHQGFTRAGCLIPGSWKSTGRDGGCGDDWTSEDCAGEYQISLFQSCQADRGQESCGCRKRL
ncbi:hypothetical protein OIU77_000700 [Salix suchowensis]|uniref:Peptidylprolyl isomerase n=1 Tax=Salix suchowensis TaxID=1278906 RepID=A0ABQ9B6Z8_9ROSI|nr:hypothetical protein OIU77_000700 [Salix suchowensis]